MEKREIMQRVVGVLTEGLEMRRLVRENPEGDALDSGDVIGELLNEMMPRIEFAADASAKEVTAAVSRELSPAIENMVAAFTFAFVQLAEVHDEGRTDASTADVLQSISLHFENDGKA